MLQPVTKDTRQVNTLTLILTLKPRTASRAGDNSVKSSCLTVSLRALFNPYRVKFSLQRDWNVKALFPLAETAFMVNSCICQLNRKLPFIFYCRICNASSLQIRALNHSFESGALFFTSQGERQEQGTMVRQTSLWYCLQCPLVSPWEIHRQMRQSALAQCSPFVKIYVCGASRKTLARCLSPAKSTALTSFWW